MTYVARSFLSRARFPAPGHICGMSDDQLRANLRRLLLEKNRSARSVGLAVGLSESAIKHILRGTSVSPRYENVVAIARELGVSVRELTGSQDLPAPPVSQLDEKLVKDQTMLRLLRYWEALTDEARDAFMVQIMDSILTDRSD